MRDELSKKSVWIFDLDGTLTNPVHDFAFMRSELGMPVDADILQMLAATSGAEKIHLTHKLDSLEALYAKQAAPAAGVKQLIEYLASKDCMLGIFTRNTKEIAMLSLEAIAVAQYFNENAIIGRDEAPHKPDPQGITYLLDQWQASVDDSVMVGDFKYDLQAGKSAGVSTIHIYQDERRWPELTDFCFSDLVSLRESLL